MNNDEKREQEVLKCLKSSNRTNDMVCIFPKTDLMKIMIKALEEIQQYRAIGTVDECRAAVEKQETKIANLSGDGYADEHLVYDTYECPHCGEHYELDYDRYEYCPNCGQHMKIKMESEEK